MRARAPGFCSASSAWPCSPSPCPRPSSQPPRRISRGCRRFSSPSGARLSPGCCRFSIFWPSGRSGQIWRKPGGFCSRARGSSSGFRSFPAFAVLYVEAIHAAVISGALPLATAAFSALLMRERASPAFWIVAVIGFGLVVTFAWLASEPGGKAGLGLGISSCCSLFCPPVSAMCSVHASAAKCLRSM